MLPQLVQGLSSGWPLLAAGASGPLYTSLPAISAAGKRVLPTVYDLWSQRNVRGFSAQVAPVEVVESEPKKAEQKTIVGHPGIQRSSAGHSYLMFHPVYEEKYLHSINPKHKAPERIHENIGFYVCQGARKLFDLSTGYGEHMDEKKWLRRMLFLETVAGVPGMVGGMLRHLKSLRSLKRDHGWIHTLLEEAENERMHLLTFMKLRQPGPLFRAAVIAAQGVFFNAYFISYLLSPKTCHSFVGYLEEEAVKTYTHAIKDIEEGKNDAWKVKPAPDIAIRYWKLKEGATMYDLLLAVRADEACHSHVNHTFADMKGTQNNPFDVGNHVVP